MQFFSINNRSVRVQSFLVLLISFYIICLSNDDVLPVVDRTPHVGDAIIAAAGVNSAVEVTDADLAAITALNLREKELTTLKSGNFSGMSRLTSLNLYDNELSELPANIF